MRKIRWGVLSTANIAQKEVIPALQRATNAEVVAIASLSNRAKEVASQYHIPKAYDTYEELLKDPTIDAVYIPLPNHLHKVWTIEAAKSGKHVLCEKPASLTAEETEEMISACQEHGVRFMEAFMYQFHPQHERVRELIKNGEIGSVKLMRASFSFYLADFKENIRMNPAMGGGSIYDVGCYGIHAIRYVLQEEPKELQIHANINSEHQVDTSAVGYMKMESGIVATFDASFEMTYRAEYEVIGTKGSIKVPRAFRPDIDDGIGLVIVQNEHGVKEEIISGDIYRLQVEHFSQTILENNEPSYSPENTIQNMRVLDACYQSLKTGGKITL
ncbi:gfo/Idh/MocA family oxidoreductase [Anaerobacillus alkaliphilus]|uniref:Gfo/Idh/MocA family oxidoreductase n=1 Tax=Anaerobacillus alkaliphilus TaxID=1548597 RepID=A0A4Q0VUA5_9BACI|nr:Gfo/Idh/MocA family oxidoreductase [Anaerobacillus alkaliphilus]RXJ02091.1 gfo/Idh/MocA family oxidoreductase [Anaerobacillus alkaliphilus]